MKYCTKTATTHCTRNEILGCFSTTTRSFIFSDFTSKGLIVGFQYRRSRIWTQKSLQCMIEGLQVDIPEKFNISARENQCVELQSFIGEIFVSRFVITEAGNLH